MAKDRAANPAHPGLMPEQQPYLNTPAQQKLKAEFEAQVAKINADRDKQLADLEKANKGGIDFGPSPGNDDNSVDDPGSDDDGNDLSGTPPPPGPWPRASDTRGMRNNNPTNLMYAPGQPGVRGSDGRFGIYATMGEGVRADMRQYLLYQKRDHLLSVRDMVLKATPRSDNPDVDRYIAEVARQLHVGAGDPIDLTNPQMAEAFINAVSRQESGRAPDPASVHWGVNRALGMSDTVGGRMPTGAPAVTDRLRAAGDPHPTSATYDIMGIPKSTKYQDSLDWGLFPPILKELGFPWTSMPSRASLALVRDTAGVPGGTTPLPPRTNTAGGSGSTQHHVTFDGNFQLQWPNGSPAAAPITTQSRVGIPVPSGSSG